MNFELQYIGLFPHQYLAERTKYMDLLFARNTKMARLNEDTRCRVGRDLKT